jgi:hypothetical protein
MCFFPRRQVSDCLLVVELDPTTATASKQSRRTRGRRTKAENNHSEAESDNDVVARFNLNGTLFLSDARSLSRGVRVFFLL